MFAPRFLSSILLGGFVCFAGCGDRGDGVHVAGVVTLDGQPLPGAQVLFHQPELGPNENIGYIGMTDAAGRYSLRPMMGEGSGVPPGEYHVSMTTALVDSSAPPPQPGRAATPFYPEERPTLPERIPPTYRTGNVTFPVPEDGTDAANFDLKSR